MQIAVREGRVTEAVAEGVERCASVVQVGGVGRDDVVVVLCRLLRALQIEFLMTRRLVVWRDDRERTGQNTFVITSLHKPLFLVNRTTLFLLFAVLLLPGCISNRPSGRNKQPQDSPFFDSPGEQENLH